MGSTSNNDDVVVFRIRLFTVEFGDYFVLLVIASLISGCGTVPKGTGALFSYFPPVSIYQPAENS